MTDATQEVILKELLQDERLEGWVQATSCFVSPGSTVEIVAVVPLASGDLFDRREGLAVYVATTHPDEERSVMPLPLFFKREGDASLAELEDFEALIANTIGRRDFWNYLQEFEAEEVGSSIGIFEPAAVDVAFGLVAGAQHVLAGLRQHDAALADRLAVIVGNAYCVGHLVATWALKEQYEGAAAAGIRVRAGAAKGGQETGKKVTEAAVAWYAPFLTWFEPQVAAENAKRAQPMNQDQLGGFAEGIWPPDGFGSQKVCPARSTLVAAMRWGQKQEPPLFDREPAPRGARKRSQ